MEKFDELTSLIQKENNSIKYWESLNLNKEGIAELRHDYISRNSYNKGSISFSIDSSLNERLKAITNNNDLPLYVIFTAALNIQLYKYTDKENNIVGIPIHGFNISSNNVIQNKVLPLRSTLNNNVKIKEFLMELRKNLLDAYENQHCNLENILRSSKICTDIMDLTPISIAINSLHSIENVDYICNSNKNQITVYIDKQEDKLADISFIYNSNLFKKETMDLFGKAYIKILNELVTNINGKIEDINIITEKERNQILYDFNDTKAEYPKDKTIQELFEEQVEKTPNNIAVVFEDEELSYRELNEKSNSLARVLRNKGVRADSIVGIMVERSLEMIVGIMGILKAGGAYLPIDPSYPKDRIEYMINDSSMNILITSDNFIKDLKFSGHIIDITQQEIFNEENSNLDIINSSANLAYVIYTSGSTGKPKGVMIEHKQVNNFIMGIAKDTKLDCYESILCITTICFDIFGLETLVPLNNGLKVVIASESEQISGESLLEVIEKHRVDVMQSTPSRLNMLISGGKFENIISKLKLLLVGGETLQTSTFKNLYKYEDLKIYNVYGPTETTIWSTTKLLQKDEPITIGKPISNTKIYILDKSLNIVPVGVSGELCISGDGLARGYLNRPELTAEKFIDNPFEPGTKMYRTGDLARWLPDGNIEFIGRMDNQVKIRGFRIELGEIESRLVQHEDVKEAVVLAKENVDGEKYLCAYVVCEKEFDSLSLRNYLKETLPEYMVPTYFMNLEKMPLTSNGKIDRKALPQPSMNELSLNKYEAPRNEVEETLVKIWCEVLGVEKIGINDNFFDLGGHSLKATVLVSKIHKELNVEVPLKELFKTPTIKELSEFINTAEENLYGSIKNVEERAWYEASSAQKRMYMLQQFDKKSVAYNMPAVYELEGKIDKERIENTFKKLVERHEGLRTYFETIEGEIVQKINNSYEFKLIFRKDDENLENIISSFIKPFELERGPLFRVELIENNENTYLLIDMHHIMSDGVSMSILIKEFAAIYNGEELDPLRIQYKDFAEWQNKFLKSDEMKKQEEYWVSRFSDELPVLNLPYDYERPLVQSFEGDNISFSIDEETTEGLRRIAKETGSTMNMVLLSAFNILLSKYSGQEDIIIGMPIAGRPHADLQNIMGMFVNTLAIRNNPRGEKTYLEFLKEVKENSLKAYENQSYQFEELIEKINVRRDISRNPIFDVMFNMTNIDYGTDLELDNLILKQNITENKTSKFDLTLNAVESEKALEFNLQYCKGLFKEETARRISEHYIQTLSSICKKHTDKISEVEILAEKERNQILYDFNDTKVEYPKDKTIQELFEEQVEKTPNNIAVVFEDEELSYRELNEKSNSLARVLRNKGVKADSIVGIMVERSLEMIIGIMGILKAGGAYLPIDPSYPKERIEYILEDSKSNLLLSTKDTSKDINFSGEIIDLLDEELFKGDIDNLSVVNNHNDLAYVIYTSGSTGTPKGVLIEHKNVNNLISALKKQFREEFTSKDRVLSLTNYIFDVSVGEFFTSLTAGSSLIINRKHKNFDSEEIAKLIIKNKVTFTYIPPSLLLEVYKKLLKHRDNISLTKLLVGVEAISGGTLKNFYDINQYIEIVNGYGPTEAAICATFYSVSGKESIDKAVPIGRPISNTTIYILDKSLNIVPVGVSGELCIGGDGLARGYLNRPELTAEKFIDNPFEPGTKMYRTGDLARWLPDGNIEFIGRMDNQVKIRGFRIELGEIESRLVQHEDVKEAVVLAKENVDGEKYLCAYVVCEKEFDSLSLRNYLKETLPEYMVPTYFMNLEKMPLTSNGKIDRKALPQPSMNELSLNKYEAPRNEVEETLVKIWCEVLGVEKIGINDNFFDLGGHSLKATVLVSKIHKELNVEVPLKELFKTPTIKELSEFINTAEENLYGSIKNVEERAWYEASSAQKRMYMLQQFDKKSVAYNMPAVYELEGKIDKERIENTFKKLVERHEGLRTYFETIEDEIVQKINNSYEFKLIFRKDDENLENIISSFIKPFELERGPLFRVELIENNENTYLLIDMHHIMSDGVSMSILIKEFAAIYNGEELDPLRIQYKDFAEWQNKFLKSDEMKKQEEYWVSRFSDELPVLNLPYDYERPLVQSFEGDNISFSIDEETTEGLRRIAKETGSTMNMVLLSAFNILLSKYSGQEDIIIGMPIAGRPHADLQNIMGMFVNTLAIRNNPRGEKTYLEFLKEVKENSLKAYENQSYQFEELIEKINVRRDISRNPIFDVMFNMTNIDYGTDLELDNLILKQNITENKTSKFDLTLNAVESEKALEFNLQYCKGLFKEETARRISEHYIQTLSNICKKHTDKISEVEILAEKERNQILYDFNDTKVEYPKDKTIQELFEEQVEKTPNNIAVVFEDEELSYRELNEKSNSLARVLRNKGVKADSIVGIMVERSLEMIIGIMGILKAGGAYLPIDPSYPKERIEYILKDSKSNLLLSTKDTLKDINFSGETIDLLDEELFKGDIDNLSVVNNHNDLAYVIYTSGSTGAPKGVLIEHKNVNNLVLGLSRNIYFMYNIKLNIALVSPYYFDASVKQIFAALEKGHTLYIVDEETRSNGEALLEYYQRNQIDISDGTPMHLAIISNSIHKKHELRLKHLIIGGDALGVKPIKEIYRVLKNINISNVYGPTECCVDSSIYLVEPQKIDLLNNIPIGMPMANYKIYILDKSLNIVPVGVSGELCISGDGLARGYLNRPELTAEKFIDNPFEPGTKMYRTGDLARWLPDGNIEFIGRMDNQVKIRGFRIELGEIESRLVQHEDVKEAVVLAKENVDGEKYLCAYVVCEKEFDSLSLRNYLKETLPEYMVPTYFMNLEKMPLTSNGKIDRKALPQPSMNELSLNKYEAPRNEVEETLVKIWCEVLGVEKIGINDNFFDLGGHSLKATVLVSKIHKELNVEVPLKELFKTPTIKELSEFINTAEENLYGSIKNVEERAWYEASSAQKRMYMLQQFDKKSVAYNMPAVYELEGKIDKERIKNTFKKLVERHEGLRTYFETIEGEIVQKINNSYEFKLIFRKDDENLENIISSFIKPFELERGPLFRVELIENNENTYLLIDMHHIMSDGVSMSILIKEFAAIYNGEELDPLRIQYKDFAEWQNKFLKSDEMKKQEEYWVSRFSDELPVLNLPYDYERPLVQSFEGDNISFSIDEETTEGLRRIAKETGSTMNMVLLSAFNILLSKYSGQEDIIIGMPIAGRPHADLQNIMGMFVNTLAIRNNPSGEKTYLEFLKEVKENLLKAYENQSYQFEELIEKINVRRDTSRNPIFDVMLVLQNMDASSIGIESFSLKPYNARHQTSKFDLLISAIELDDNIQIRLEYCTKLFKKQTIERIIDCFLKVLQVITKSYEIKLEDMEILTAEETEKLLYELNDTDMKYPKDKTLQELFEEQVKRSPNNIAVSFEEQELTYSELNNRSNQIANRLIQKGVKRNSIVAIFVEKSIDTIPGVMGILKSGAICLPINTEYPDKRIEYMLEDSRANIIVTQSKLNDRIMNKENFTLINIDIKENYEEFSTKNVELKNYPNDDLYVIYTSGTTGNPKGVVVGQRVLNNLIYHDYLKTDIDFKNKVLQYSNISFDAFFHEVLATLLIGGEVCITSDEVKKDVMMLFKYLERKEITTINIPAALAKIIFSDASYIDKFPREIKHLIATGEQLLVSNLMKKYIKENDLVVHNHYGPSETHVATTYTMNSQSYINSVPPIGKPIINSKVYILGSKHKLKPLGAIGELYIAGDCLGTGYLNRQELTAEKFIENPFESGTKMYKTGDLARWLPDGNIEFLGRIDSQVKIRGFRIELGEIETKLLSNENVREAVVLAKDNEKNEKYLCAYVVCENEFDNLSLRNYLKDALPEYMVPAFFVQLKKIPLTSNEKVDTKALPQPSMNELSLNKYEAPRNEVEETLVKIWCEVLGVEKIGINDNFFDLGGHSLKATVLVSKIHKELNVEVPLKELFKTPTIKELSEFINTAEENLYGSIKNVEERAWYEASSAQKRMYMLQQFDKKSVAYNMPAVYELEGKIDKERIENTFKKLVERHEGLRTYFETIEGEIVQKINNSYEFKLIFRKDDENLENIISSFIKPFELERGPLFRVELIENNENTYLLIDMHHIMSDGVSMSILIKEFAAIYNGEELDPLRIQYKDFAEWQNKFLKSDEMKKQEEYWVSRFSDELPVLNLPYDYERPLVQSFEGDNISFSIDEETTEGLRRIAKETGSTMNMVLLSAFNILLSKYSGQEDIIIGMPIAGRPHADLQNIMGMFVNTLAIRNNPSGEKTYLEFLKEVNENSLKAYENQSYQFEELIEKINVRRDISRNPVFDVMFNMTNIDYGMNLELDSLILKQNITENKTSKVDLTLSAFETDKSLILNFQYSSKLFKRDTIEILIRDINSIINSFSKNNVIQIKKIDIIDEKEQHVILKTKEEMTALRDIEFEF
jgi:tyrocidine synthetase-3